MKITAIKAQVRNSNRISVFVDEKYSFSLTHAQLLEQKIYSGLEISEERLQELQGASDFGKALERVTGYLAVRPRSKKEIEDYCWRKKISPQDCGAIIDRMTRIGYIDDAKFARSWVESRRLTKATSARKLQLELRQKGVADDIIAATLEQGEHNDKHALREMIAKKRRHSRYQDDQKLIQYLIRQGFSYDDVKRALVTDGQ